MKNSAKKSPQIIGGSSFTLWVHADGSLTNVDATIVCNDGENTSISYVHPIYSTKVFKVFPNKICKKLMKGATL